MFQPIALQESVLSAFSALLLSLLICTVSNRVASRFDIMDIPSDRSMHSYQKPCLGGSGIFVGSLLPLLYFPLDTQQLGFLIGALVVFCTGLVDDMVNLRPRYKFIGQIIAASLYVWISGNSLTNLGNFLGIGDIVTGSFAPVITVIGIVGVINALNLSDGLDGLAAGMSLIAAFFMSIIAFHDGRWPELLILTLFAAAILGFFKFNEHPAKMFMGDNGSMFLGYVLATVAVALATPAANSGIVEPPIMFAVILAVPILDTLKVMTKRLLEHKSPFLPGKDHIHHRLIQMGFSHAATVSILYLLMTGFGFMALLLSRGPESLLFAAALSSALVIYLGLHALKGKRHVLPEEWLHFPWPKRFFHFMTGVVGRSTRYVYILFLPAILLPVFAIIAHPPHPNLSFPLLAFAGLLFVLFPWRSRTAEQHGLLNGLIYLAIFGLLLIYNHVAIRHAAALPWLGDYLTGLSVIALIWTALKLVFKSHGETFLTPGFETMMLGISWLFPLLVLPMMNVPDHWIALVQRSCLEAVPMLLLMKIFLRNHHDRNIRLALLLFLPFLVIGGCGLFSLPLL